MKTVVVSASKTYEIRIGENTLDALGKDAGSMKGVQKVCIVSDSNVYPLYGETVCGLLDAEKLAVVSFVFPAGEGSKNGTTYLQLLQFLADNQLTRTDLIVALGGGVVGDLAGFAAATYLRGIRWIQIPTTLLAAVDSSVGGKTAIDLPAGKNLAGAFYQPDLVICDLLLLSSLPEDVFRDGCAEVIKYGVLYDEDLFRKLEEDGLGFDREYVISRCVEWKRNAVVADEFDRGLRMKLNFGHTIGHGVEAGSSYRISHGKAVAVGMAIVSRAAYAQGICNEECANRILTVLRQFSLPVFCEYDADQLLHSALSDKKRSGNSVSLILPKRIGECIIQSTPVSELKDFIQAGI